MIHPQVVRSFSITLFAVCVAALVAASSATAQVPLANQEQLQQELQQQMDAGNVHLEQREFEEAVEHFSLMLQTYGQQPAALVGRAKAYEGLQEFQAAIKDYTAALDLENIDLIGDNAIMAMAYNGRGEITLKFSATGGNAATAIQSALADFTKAVENDRSNPAYLVNQAKVLIQFAAAPQAIAALKRALRLDENNAEAYRTRGLANAQLQDFQSAAADVAKATVLEPENHENHYTKGMIFMQAKEHQQAVDAFRVAKETYKDPDPDNPVPYVEPYLAASLAYIELGKEAQDPAARQSAYSKAIEETQKALDEQPLLPLAYLNRGVALRLLELFDDALKAFTQAINMAPEFGEAYFRRGIVWYHMGDRELARKDFREAIAISYDDVRPYLWTGITYADEGKYHDAIIQYGEAINLHPRYVPAYINRGLAYAQLGEFQKAEDNFSEAIRLEPSEATHYYKRGSVLMEMDRFEDALQSFSSAISNANYYADAYRKAAEALRRLGRTELAAQYVTQADQIEAAIKQRMEELQRQGSQPVGQETVPPGPNDNVLQFEEEAPRPADAGLGENPAPADPPLGSDAAPAVPATPLNPGADNPFDG